MAGPGVVGVSGGSRLAQRGADPGDEAGHKAGVAPLQAVAGRNHSCAEAAAEEAGA